MSFDRSFQNDKVHVYVNATKSSSLEPWNITLSVKAYNFEKGSLHFEQQAKDLSASTVTFDWTDETTCIIGFPDDDGSIRKFQLTASSAQFTLAEIEGK